MTDDPLKRTPACELDRDNRTVSGRKPEALRCVMQAAMLPYGPWERWFAWQPVRLLTWEIGWLRWVERRKHDGCYEYANPMTDVERAKINKIMEDLKR